jgi:hypothetical protein
MIYVIQDEKEGEMGEAAPVYWRGQGQPLGTKKYYIRYYAFFKEDMTEIIFQ